MEEPRWLQDRAGRFLPEGILVLAVEPCQQVVLLVVVRHEALGLWCRSPLQDLTRPGLFPVGVGLFAGEANDQVVLHDVVKGVALDVVDGLRGGDALDGGLAPQLLHLLAALRDDRGQRFHDVSVGPRRFATQSTGAAPPRSGR